MRGNAKKAAIMGLFAAAAMILGYVESFIPFFYGIPGMKLGLANASIVMVLYVYSWREALFISLVRILGLGFLFGNLFGIAFSTAGALVSLLFMGLAKKSGLFDCVGVSMIGGVMHNAGQLLVAMVILQSSRIFGYFFLLMLSGALTGLVIGFLAGELTKRLKGVLR